MRRCVAGVADARRRLQPVACPDAAAHTAQDWTVWVKRTGERVVQYTSLKGVDPQQTVDDFKARWVSHVQLGVHAELVTLRLVKRGPGVPTPSEEASAPSLEPLEPRHTLREAGIADGGSLLAVIAGACGTL